MEIINKDEAFRIIGAAMEVHQQLKNGFLEEVYQEALEREFVLQNIPFESQKLLRISYKGSEMDHFFKADFMCFDKIVVEIKATSEIGAPHIAQMVNYLKCTGCKLGLLLNFGEKSLKFKRIVL